jgi:hypothetical protein
MCLFYKKPMLKSENLGLKSNFQIIIPYLTEILSLLISSSENQFLNVHFIIFHQILNHSCRKASDLIFNFFEKDFENLTRYLENNSLLNELQKTNTGKLYQI